MAKTRILFTEMSKADFDGLTPALQEECKLLLQKLEGVGKKLGIALEDKNGKDLRGYYKLYFDEARYRIVYTVVDGDIEITALGETFKESLEIVGIGKRDKEQIYKIIHQRINMQ
jgi:mRNA-degrading endonuclease RelE of RelBE toxin-antitoxin system